MARRGAESRLPVIARRVYSLSAGGAAARRPGLRTHHDCRRWAGVGSRHGRLARHRRYAVLCGTALHRGTDLVK